MKIDYVDSGAHIQPHCGPTNAKLRANIPVGRQHLHYCHDDDKCDDDKCDDDHTETNCRMPCLGHYGQASSHEGGGGAQLQAESG